MEPRQIDLEKEVPAWRRAVEQQGDHASIAARTIVLLADSLSSTQSQLAQAREEGDAAYEEIRLSRESEWRVYADLLATREDLERVRSEQFDVGFVEACAILAAKPFDRPTLAAHIIREGGVLETLLTTKSDYAGVEILRKEMERDISEYRAALATNQKEADRRALQGGKDGEA